MRRSSTCLLLAFLAGMLPALRSTAQSNLNGDRFWIAFMANYGGGGGQYLRVYIAGDPGTTGLVSLPLGSWSAPFTVPAAGSVSVNVPLTAICALPDSVEGKGVLVESTAPITLHALNFEMNTADATVIYPETALGTEYFAMAYPGITGFGQLVSELVVLATEDSTLVEITPSCLTSAGQPAGIPFNVFLNAGETYLMYGNAATDDVTGTRVRVSNPVNCKRIALFSGSMCANVPVGCFACDHLYEQMPALFDWSTRYFLSPFTGPTSYTYRVLAAEDNTTYAIDGVTQPVLMSGQFAEANTVTGAACITANKPISVAQYMQGQLCSGSGDPAMVMIPGDNDPTARVTFSTVSSVNLTNHHLNLVTDTSNIGLLTLDGAPVPITDFTVYSTCGDRAWATVPLADGIHTVEAPSGFSGFVYGGGINWETYAFSLGSRSLPGTDSLICAGPGPLVLNAPSTMGLPIWADLDSPDDTLAIGPTYTYIPGGNAVITVRDTAAATACFGSLRYHIEVDGSIAVSILVDQASLCPPSTALLVADVQPDTTGLQYQWIPSLVFPLNADQDSVQVIVPSSTAFQVLVSSQAGCPLGQASVAVFAYPPPVQPVISLIADTLFSTPAASYTWYLNGNPIPGANASWVVPTIPGIYGVGTVDANGCPSLSAPYLYPPTGIASNSPIDWQVWDAGDHLLKVEAALTITDVQVGNTLGQLVLQAEPRATSAAMDVRNGGLYIVQVTIGGERFVQRAYIAD